MQSKSRFKEKKNVIEYLPVNTGVSIEYGYKFSIMLSGLIYKYSYYMDRKYEVFVAQDKFFYITQYDLLLLTGLGFKEQNSILKQMEDMKLISRKYEGETSKKNRYIYLYYKRTMELIEDLDKRFKEIRAQGVQKTLERNNLPTLQRAIKSYWKGKIKKEEEDSDKILKELADELFIEQETA